MSYKKIISGWVEVAKPYAEDIAAIRQKRGPMKSLEQICVEQEQQIRELQQFKESHSRSAAPLTESEARERRKLALVESFKSIGLTEDEARVAAGVPRDTNLREAMASGATAAEFWEAIKNLKD